MALFFFVEAAAADDWKKEVERLQARLALRSFENCGKGIGKGSKPQYMSMSMIYIYIYINVIPNNLTYIYIYDSITYSPSSVFRR